MNYAQARLRDDDSGLWDWTTKNDHNIWRSRPCTEACHHISEEEACLHFYTYCLEQVSVLENTEVQYKCAICQAWTTKSMGNIQMWLDIRPIYLCKQHLNKESLERVHPFQGAFQLIHS